MKNYRLLLGFIFLITGILPVYTQDDIESQLDDMILNGQNNGSSSLKSDMPKWDFFGYFESENFFGLDSANNSPDNELIKLELRSRLSAKYGTEFNYAKGVFDVYFYPEIALTNIVDSGVIEPYEFYLALGKEFQFKIGKIVHNWGTADAFRITNYLDQRDLRELFMKEEDERYRGSYSASFKYLFGNFSLETVAVAGLNPVIFPGTGSYWEIRPAEQDGIQPVLQATQPSNNYEDISAGIRGGGTIGVFDFHLSYFYGTNSSIVMVPNVTMNMVDPANPVVLGIDLYPDYAKVHKIGLDTALNIEKLALRVEGVFTFNQNALYSDDTETTIIETDTPGEVIVRRNTTEVPYLAFTAGLDYNLWGPNGRVLIEYTNAYYTENASKYEEEFFSNFLLLTIQDKFFNEHLEVKLTGIMRPDTDPGFMTGGSISYDFQNGMILTLGAMVFVGGSDSMLQTYENSDLAYFRLKMNF